MVLLGVLVVVLGGAALTAWRRRHGPRHHWRRHEPLPETGQATRRRSLHVTEAQYAQERWEGGKRLPGQDY